MDTIERIDGQIAEMEANLAAFVESANRQIAAQQGGIEALRMLRAALEEGGAVRGELNDTPLLDGETGVVDGGNKAAMRETEVVAVFDGNEWEAAELKRLGTEG